MQPPKNIDMGLIREALARRSQGQLGGGTTAPMSMQVARPTAPMANGQSPTPMQAPPPVVPAGNLQTQQAPQQAPQGAQKPQAGQEGAGFDDGTKALTKALVQRLLKVL